MHGTLYSTMMDQMVVRQDNGVIGVAIIARAILPKSRMILMVKTKFMLVCIHGEHEVTEQEASAQGRQEIIIRSIGKDRRVTC